MRDIGAPHGTSTTARTDRALGYVPALDGLRAVAVGAVLIFHLSPDLMPGGFLGVSSFFTLSGFLITGLLLGELETVRSVDLGRFWARRVKRLVPAALAVTVAALLLTLTPWAGWGKGLMDSEVVAAAFNVVNWHLIALPAERFPGPVGPFWSLGVEEQFYAAMALVFLVLRRRPDRAAPRLAALAAVVWAVSLAVAVMLHTDHPREMFGTDVRSAELAAGALLAVWVRRVGVGSLRTDGTRRRVIGVAGWVGLALTLVAFRWGHEDQGWVLAGGFAALSLVHCAVITGALSDGRMARLLGTRPMVAVGKLSYALYLVQWPVILTLRSDRMHLSGAPVVLVRLAVCLAAAVALHLAVERPIRHHWRASNRVTIVAWLVAMVAVSGLAAAAL